MKEQNGGFIITLFKNRLTNENLLKLGLSNRQMQAVSYVKEHGKISNADYQKLLGVSKATATRDLTELIETFNLLEKLGKSGAGTIYVIK
jgi:ATP-dependent DNA helicase RecG